MVEALVFVDLHAREDLLAEEPSLDSDVGRAVDQPGQIDGHHVALVGNGILRKVVRQELVVAEVEACLRNRLRMRVLRLQVVVVVLKEVRLLVLRFKLVLPL